MNQKKGPGTAAALAYKPVGLVAGVLGGVLANAVFVQIWKRVSDDPGPPAATDTTASFKEVLLGAALQGAVFAVVKAAVDRAGMRGVQRFVDHHPDPAAETLNGVHREPVAR